MRADRSPGRPGVAGLLVLAAALAFPPVCTGQYVLVSPSGDSLTFEAAELREMLDTARAMRRDIEEDPHVLYTEPLTRQPVPEDSPEQAYPWNVVTVHTDSTVDYLGLPANLREADRAYYNYAVMRMRVVRTADPDVPCDSVLALEERVVGSFIDGWILSRMLFGGPAFAALDELAFAREAGHLRALLAAKRNRQVGACAARWANENPERIAAYEAWSAGTFPRSDEGTGEAGDPAAPGAGDAGETEEASGDVEADDGS